jgi:hypothetical protein
VIVDGVYSRPKSGHLRVAFLLPETQNKKPRIRIAVLRGFSQKIFMNYIKIIPELQGFSMPVDTWIFILLVVLVWRLPNIIDSIKKPKK